MHPTDQPPEQAQNLTWVHDVGSDSDTEMAAQGLTRVRTLHQMRRTLPVSDAVGSGAAPLTVRPFRPGTDDDGFLAVNNRAFAWHPEQGGWDRSRLRSRLDEEWVRADGILVHESDAGSIDGFCWTRLHPADGTEPAMGEIYVIAADPAQHGTGLGRALVLAGLDHLAATGMTVAMLYVEADNEAALRLYERLGFAVHHSDAAYAP